MGRTFFVLRTTSVPTGFGQGPFAPGNPFDNVRIPDIQETAILSNPTTHFMKRSDISLARNPRVCNLNPTIFDSPVRSVPALVSGNFLGFFS